MPFKFQETDPVFYRGEPGFEGLAGLHTIKEVSKDGKTYRIIDAHGGYTDVDEDYLEHVTYGVFVRKDHGWPVIVPCHDVPIYNRYVDSALYDFVCNSSAKGCIDEMEKIVKKLDEQATG